MIPEERLQAIKEIIGQNGTVSIDVLAQRFHVSDMTIRRDLDKCQKMGYLQRCHGGGVSLQSMKAEEKVSDRIACNTTIKEQLGAYCATLVFPDSVVYLDAGTTTQQIAKAISSIPRITVFTNDIYIARDLIERNVKVFILGGFIQNSSGSVIGETAGKTLEEIHLDISFMGTAAISDNFDSMTPTVEKVYLRRTIVENSSASYLVADHTKFGIQSIFKIQNLSQYTSVITDKTFTEEEITTLESEGIRIHSIGQKRVN